MSAIYITKSNAQSLLALNKLLINALESKQQELKENICVFWEASDPISGTIDSTVAFNCLNASKKEMQEVKKKIKLLASVQSAIKCSIR